MKTPREILLETHRTAEPQLERLSQKVVSAEVGMQVGTPLRGVRPLENGRLGEASLPWFRRFAAQAWQELFWSCRRTWAGLAVVWVVLAVIHFADSKTASPAPQTFAVSSQDIIVAWKEQERLLAELTETARPAQAKIKPPSLPMPMPGKTSGLSRPANESLA